jgi:hypothetical protein
MFSAGRAASISPIERFVAVLFLVGAVAGAAAFARLLGSSGEPAFHVAVPTTPEPARIDAVPIPHARHVIVRVPPRSTHPALILHRPIRLYLKPPPTPVHRAAGKKAAKPAPHPTKSHPAKRPSRPAAPSAPTTSPAPVASPAPVGPKPVAVANAEQTPTAPATPAPDPTPAPAPPTAPPPTPVPVLPTVQPAATSPGHGKGKAKGRGHNRQTAGTLIALAADTAPDEQPASADDGACQPPPDYASPVPAADSDSAADTGSAGYQDPAPAAAAGDDDGDNRQGNGHGGGHGHGHGHGHD